MSELTENLSKNQGAELCAQFGERFKSLHGVMCFLLDFLPMNESAGLELSSFRRAGLFKDYFGIDTWLLTDCYQPDSVGNAIEQIKLGRLSAVRLVNLYDYLQGINRSQLKKQPVALTVSTSWQATPAEGTKDLIIRDGSGNIIMYCHRHPQDETIDYVNHIKDGKIYRRDTYDRLGFLSRTEFTEKDTGFTHTALYFRPDHSLALTETYRHNPEPEGKPIVDAINVMDRQGHTVQRFSYHDELVAYWLLQLLNDKQSFYIAIADQIMDYQRYFVELRRQQAAYPNVRVIGVSHNCHTVDPLDVMHSQPGDNYRFLFDRNQRVDRVICLTKKQKADVEERWGAQAHPIDVIPHHFVPLPVPADSAARTTGALPPHSLIMIGRFAPAKDHAAALEVFSKVKTQVPDASLHFFGSGGLMQEIKQKALDLGLEQSVIFHGFLPDLNPVYATASALMMTSRHEGFSLALQEALYAGLPVVSFDCRYGPAALIEDGVNGYLVENGDKEGMAARLVEILGDDKLRERLSQAARLSMRRFTPQRIAALWAQTLLSLLPEQDSGTAQA
ncbi:MAG: glycosyltransferase [Succinivibrio sp.]|nr:glycosyltransferase [Succinivibrio sp.]